MAAEPPRRRVAFLDHRQNHHNYGFPPEAFDYTTLPDFDHDFLPPEDLAAFAQALSGHAPAVSIIGALVALNVAASNLIVIIAGFISNAVHMLYDL